MAKAICVTGSRSCDGFFRHQQGFDVASGLMMRGKRILMLISACLLWCGPPVPYLALADSAVPAVSRWTEELPPLENPENIQIIRIDQCSYTPGSYPVVGVKMEYQLIESIRGNAGSDGQVFLWIDHLREWSPHAGNTAIYLFNGPAKSPSEVRLYPVSESLLEKLTSCPAKGPKQKWRSPSSAGEASAV